MNRNVLKLLMLIILILMAVGIIGFGIIVLLGNNNNKEQENIKKPIVNINNKKPVIEGSEENTAEEENDEEKVFYQTQKDITKFYYRINENDESEDIELFTIMTENEAKKMAETENIYDIEIVGEKNGVKYYYVSQTDAVIDIESIKEQMNDSGISEYEKNKLQAELEEYNKIIDLYNKRDQIIKSFLEE